MRKLCYNGNIFLLICMFFIPGRAAEWANVNLDSLQYMRIKHKENWKEIHNLVKVIFLFVTLWALNLVNLTCTKENGLIAYWKFDESSGSIALDTSGKGHNGTIKGAIRTSGKANKALSFDGNGCVDVPDHSDLQIQGDITIMAWIKKTQKSKKGKSMGIVSKSSEGKWDYDLFISTSKLEHPAFYSDAFSASGGDIEVISTAPITLNEWHHVAVTREGSTGKIYIDGVMRGTANLPEPLQASNRNLRIGHDHDGGFKGLIDEVRLYNRALSAAEIESIIATCNEEEIWFNHIIIDTSFGGIRAIGDINEDGFPDIVHSYWYNSAPLAWYEYKSPSNWIKHIIRKNFYPCTDDFELADIDGDGDDDIVTVRADGKRSDDTNADNVRVDEMKVIWLENPRPAGNPRIDTWQEHLIGTHSDPGENYNKDIEVADFTGDGNLDVVARAIESISIFRQDTPTSWTKIQYFRIHGHEGMDVGDVDGDGDPDIILNGFWLETPNDSMNAIWIEHNIDSKWYTQTGDWTANNCKVYVKDVNGDAQLDILLSHSERAGYPISWYGASDPRTGPWKEHVIAQIDYCHTLQAADMDNDGDIDVVVGEMEKSDDPDEIIIFRNEGNSLTWFRQSIANKSIYSGIVVDIGSDGDMDIVANRNWNQAPLEIWENDLNSND